MSYFLVALMLAVGAATWVYSKVMNRTGGNTQNALIIASVSGIMAFVMTWTALAMIDSSLQ